KPAARVGHGLQSGVRYVDNRETAMAERDRTGRGRELAPARAVRPTMRHDIDSRPLGSETDGAVKTAHSRFLAGPIRRAPVAAPAVLIARIAPVEATLCPSPRPGRASLCCVRA